MSGADRGGAAAEDGARAAAAAAAEEEEEVVEIRLGEWRFPLVRKRRLIEQSDYFRALYRSGMREAAAPVQQLRGGLSSAGLARVLRFIETARLAQEEPGGDGDGDGAADGALAQLVEAASFLQVTPLLRLLRSWVRLPNCLELHRLAELYGLPELRDACLDFMAGRLHQLLARPPPPPSAALARELRERRRRGRPALLLLGCFPDRPPLVRYGEGARRWEALPPAEPPAELLQVRGFAWAALDNYLFVAGGYRPRSQEIAAAHRYNPCLHEWRPLASMNQKR